MNLRVHHILCTPLFVGKGYSDSFVNNMKGIVDKLQNNEIVELQVTPDVICSSCPNHQDGVCTLDKNKVETKDMKLLDAMKLSTTITYEARKLFKEVSEKMTKEIFENSCSKCEWYKQGLCSYELYQLGIKKMIN